jgi:hypothetical protein
MQALPARVASWRFVLWRGHMRLRFCVVPCLLVGFAASADTLVLPTNSNFYGGAGSYDIVFSDQPRSYLVVYGTAELNGRLPIGAKITAVSWRNAGWIAHPTWPATQTTFENFDIYMAMSTRTPGQLDLSNVMNNVSELVQVRSGPLTLPEGYLPGGSVNPNANHFAGPIELDTPYIYEGGPLAIMVRHTGNPAGSAHLDWMASFYGAVGGQAIGVSSYTQNTNWYTQGHSGALSIRLVYDVPSPDPCYANCDGSSDEPLLNLSDFACFLQRFAAGDMWANCDQSTTPPVLNVADFQCFVHKFIAGCP